jgi:pyruvate/2-oxoglutarate/acetoin dehydrogenase E1 component
MNMSGPIVKSLVNVAAILSLAVPAFSQAAPKQAAPKYDPATETTFKGIVEELKIVPPTGGKPIAYLVLKDSTDPAIFLCPKKFLDDIGVVFKADDPIQITGSKIKQNGSDLTLAREVTKMNGGETLTLRFKDGRPAW